MKTQYQENITITGNQKDNVIMYIQAKSLQKKVKDWTNNSIFISNTQLISNERSITERIIYDISLVWVWVLYG